MSSITVVIADDHPAIIETLERSLPAAGLKVVGSASNVADAVALYMKHKPVVTVLDVGFGTNSVNGLEGARTILGADASAYIVFYTQHEQDEIVQEAYRLGGRAFVNKIHGGNVLADVIKQVSVGKIYFTPEVAERLALLGLRGDESPRAKLDERELDVFTRLAQGQTNDEIATALSLSRKTISLVVQSVKDKLQVQRAAEITRLAIRHRLIDS